MALSRDRPEPLLVVHGLGDRALAWRRFAAAMAPGREVVLFDLPGHGDAPPGADYRYPALVEAVGRAAEGYDRFALLGHSIGGAVAWLYAARHPERVMRLVLVEAAAPHRSRFIDGPSPPASHPYTYSRPRRSSSRTTGSARTAAGSPHSTPPSSRCWSTTSERTGGGTGRSWAGSGFRHWW